MIYQALLWRSLFFVHDRLDSRVGYGRNWASNILVRILYCTVEVNNIFTARAEPKKFIEYITWPRGDTSVEKYFTSERSERVKYFFQREKRNFVSPSDHVMFYLLYKHQ